LEVEQRGNDARRGHEAPTRRLLRSRDHPPRARARLRVPRRSGERIEDGDTVERLRELVIPPAWQEVWICPDPRGHIQATGLDARRRKQYLYHQHWREHRDREKFEEMLDFARALPRLLDRGFFRVGGEEYAAENESFGLATMRKEHVSVDGPIITFDYPAKSGRRLVRPFGDREVCEIMLKLKRRRGAARSCWPTSAGAAGSTSAPRTSTSTSSRRRAAANSAKDFRTWNATVLAATALAVSGSMASASPAARKRVKTRAVKEVSRYLGNTPAVARASYTDPRVFDRYDAGLTIGGALTVLVEDDDIGAPGVRLRARRRCST